MPESTFTGVFPVSDLEISISTNGDSDSPTFSIIKDLEKGTIAIEGNVEKWNALDAGGWQRALMTAKSITLSLGAKRNIGDPGNDYIASKAMKIGRDCDSIVKIKFPNDDYIELPSIIDVKNVGTGEAVNAAPLEFDAISNGKPKYKLAGQTNVTA